MFEFGIGVIVGVIITFIVAMNTIGKENCALRNKIKELNQNDVFKEIVSEIEKEYAKPQGYRTDISDLVYNIAKNQLD